MSTSKLAVMAILFSCFVATGCDAESPPSPEQSAIMDDSGSDDGNASDDDDDDGDDRAPLGLRTPGDPAARGIGLHPCGNAILDDGEQCDDGLANGSDRECTLACTFNACELDAQGVCEGHWPAADVDLYPCADLPSDHDGCELGYARR